MTTYNEFNNELDNTYIIKKAMYDLVGSSDISTDANMFKDALKQALDHYGVC